jgi:hypothetical protein
MLREVMLVLCGACVLAGANAPAQEAPDVRGLLNRDRNVQRETSQAQGDALLGENGIDLTSEQKALVHLYVTALLCTARDGDPQTRTFSRRQIERLRCAASLRSRRRRHGWPFG